MQQTLSNLIRKRNLEKNIKILHNRHRYAYRSKHFCLSSFSYPPPCTGWPGSCWRRASDGNQNARPRSTNQPSTWQSFARTRCCRGRPRKNIASLRARPSPLITRSAGNCPFDVFVLHPAERISLSCANKNRTFTFPCIWCIHKSKVAFDCIKKLYYNNMTIAKALLIV